MSSEMFDYVVCGGGTSGCVIAGRLAEDLNVTVCVIEAGPDNADLENVHMVGGWSQNFDSHTDWNIVSEPAVGINGRRVKNSRGRFLGGCSGVNGTLCIRGNKQDYDDWGLEGWSGEDMWRAMAKTETFHPKDDFEADLSVHGTNGPLHTEPHDLAPISKRILDSMQSQGIPYKPDLFSTGVAPQGCSNTVRTVHQGIRSTGADFITKGYRRDNITIKTESVVDKVILEPVGGELTATGVKFVSKDGTELIVHARKEIIISSGSYCSPAVLLRSGIGPKSELEKHGIQTQVELSGVGKNLMDHAISFVFYESNQPELTNDHLAYYDDVPAWKNTSPINDPHGKAYDPGRDPMALLPIQPNIEWFSTEMYGGPKQYDRFPTDGQGVFALISMLLSPRSRGSVTLASRDPTANPVVDHNYLGDELDLLVMAEACRWGNEIITKGAGTKDIVKGSWPPDANHHLYTTREQWSGYAKEHATTCLQPFIFPPYV
ncbi:Glucose-methanol-choline oxidoreductase [Macrophomina phaseolina MS6]|uniref:Glucose-methanol-choline oxidoreductase n=1 Tax=Macrophomina phaseolina (strain MS6) TaxID=1126212 RepID=K2SM82_MACPH|nr:Glucose-methanol-choline oxidoreductase [Macrophomina phaseolina MS6]